MEGLLKSSLERIPFEDRPKAKYLLRGFIRENTLSTSSLEVNSLKGLFKRGDFLRVLFREKIFWRQFLLKRPLGGLLCRKYHLKFLKKAYQRPFSSREDLWKVFVIEHIFFRSSIYGRRFEGLTEKAFGWSYLVRSLSSLKNRSFESQL